MCSSSAYARYSRLSTVFEPLCHQNSLGPNPCCTCHFALTSPYWQSFEEVLPYAHCQSSQGAIPTRILYPCRDSQSTPRLVFFSVANWMPGPCAVIAVNHG